MIRTRVLRTKEYIFEDSYLIFVKTVSTKKSLVTVSNESLVVISYTATTGGSAPAPLLVFFWHYLIYSPAQLERISDVTEIDWLSYYFGPQITDFSKIKSLF